MRISTVEQTVGQNRTVRALDQQVVSVVYYFAEDFLKRHAFQYLFLDRDSLFIRIDQDCNLLCTSTHNVGLLIGGVNLLDNIDDRQGGLIIFCQCDDIV